MHVNTHLQVRSTLHSSSKRPEQTILSHTAPSRQRSQPSRPLSIQQTVRKHCVNEWNIRTPICSFGQHLSCQSRQSFPRNQRMRTTTCRGCKNGMGSIRSVLDLRSVSTELEVTLIAMEVGLRCAMACGTNGKDGCGVRGAVGENDDTFPVVSVS